jgi:valyl-tRNA synthetase
VSGRDEVVESRVGALVELVRAIRNARAEARIEPATWLPVDVAMGQALGDTFEALRPAIARLARARPLERHLTAEALHAARRSAEAGLTVIAGEIEAVVGRPTAAPGGSAADTDRARLERELADAEVHLAAARSRLANDDFLAKAPPAVVDGARTSEAELADQVARLRSRLGS